MTYPIAKRGGETPVDQFLLVSCAPSAAYLAAKVPQTGDLVTLTGTTYDYTVSLSGGSGVVPQGRVESVGVPDINGNITDLTIALYGYHGIRSGYSGATGAISVGVGVETDDAATATAPQTLKTTGSAAGYAAPMALSHATAAGQLVAYAV